MRRAQLFVLVVAAAVGNVQGQTITKSIGPDGRVIYSSAPAAGSVRSEVLEIQTRSPNRPQDRLPQAELSASMGPSAPKVSSTASQIAPSRVPTWSGPAGRAPKSAIHGTALNAPAAGSALTALATNAALDPALEKAVIGVLGIQDLLSQAQRLCSDAAPESLERFSAAAKGWDERNRPLVDKARQIIGEVWDGKSRQALEAGLKLRNTSTLTTVREAPDASKLKWCDQSAQSFESGAMDLASKGNLVGPLMSYHP